MLAKDEKRKEEKKEHIRGKVGFKTSVRNFDMRRCHVFDQRK